MPTNTYVALDKVTVGTATPSITFTGISQGYTDLVVVFQTGMSSAGNEPYLRFNSDSGSNYSETMMYGNGTTATSLRSSISTAIQLARDVGLPTALESMHTVNIQNYSNTTTFKTVLARASKGSATYSQAAAYVGLWRSTAAITSITISTSGGNLVAGSTFSLYGIKAQVQPGTAKATGGTITYDNFGRVIHTFTASGTFTPTSALTGVEYLVIGGGAGGAYSGGGGAGGYRSSASGELSGGGASAETTLSLPSGTGVTVTVGGGGAGGTGSGSQGVDSVFGTITSLGGGGGRYANPTANGASGGSGGGGAAVGTTSSATGGAGTAGQGYAGGGATGNTSYNYGGGGGGAGSVGVTVSPGVPGNGGSGVSSSINGTATGRAGGGGGGTAGNNTRGTGTSGGGSGEQGAASPDSTAGTANTGGGGGGGYSTAGKAGGSGIVIVRYQG